MNKFFLHFLQRCPDWVHLTLCCLGCHLQLSPVAALSDCHHRGWVRVWNQNWSLPPQARGNTHWGQVRQRPLLSPFRQSCLRRSPTSFHFFNTPARILPSSKVKNLKAKVRCNRSNNFIFSFFTRLPSRNPSHLLLCILLALLSNRPRHTLDMVEAVQVSVPLGLSTNIFSTSQAVNSSASVPPAWSLLLSKLFLPLAPATTSFVLFCQVGLYPDCKRWKGHPV